MKARWTGNLTWISLMLLFVLLLILVGFFYQKEVKLVPFVIGFPTLLLLVILWIGCFYPKVVRWVEIAVGEGPNKSKNLIRTEKNSEFTEWQPVLVIMGWIFLFFVFVFFFGFALISPVFITCFLIRKALMRWYVAFTYALIAIMLIYIFMEGLIKADLWCGAIPEIIPGLLGGAIIPQL